MTTVFGKLMTLRNKRADYIFTIIGNQSFIINKTRGCIIFDISSFCFYTDICLSQIEVKATYLCSSSLGKGEVNND